MKAWLVLPALAFCYNLRNTSSETDDENEKKFQLRSSIEVKWQNGFDNEMETEIEMLLCGQVLQDSDNCQLVDSGKFSFISAFGREV